MPPRTLRTKSYSKSTPRAPFSSKNPYPLGDPSISDSLNVALAELELSYDASLGVIMGDAITSVPDNAKLGALKTHLRDLVKAFDRLIGIDHDLLEKVDDVLRERGEEVPENVTPAVETPRAASEDFEDAVSSFPEPQLETEVKKEVVDIPEELEEPVKPLETLPISLPEGALELGLYVDEGPPASEALMHEYLQKKYAVSVYPASDLADKLCGTIPDTDLSHLKPANQVQFATFATHIESFFRPFCEEDIAFLEKKAILPTNVSTNPNPHSNASSNMTLETSYDPSILPFLTPKLGRPYTEVWADEDSAPGAALVTRSFEAYVAKGSLSEVNDDNLDTDDVSVGALSSRLLSGLMGLDDFDQIEVKEEEAEGEEEEEEEEEEEGRAEVCSAHISADDEHTLAAPKPDYATLEQRLKRELKYVGVFLNEKESDDKKKKDEAIEDVWLEEMEDDEVCVELRKLQGQLKTVSKANNIRKRRLIPIIEEQIAWQEFISISEDLDKQIDQAYLKRIKVPKSKKKKLAPTQTPTALAHAVAKLAHEQAANSGMKALIDKKARWFDQIGPLFAATELMRRPPTESIFAGLDFEEEEEEEEDGGIDEVEAM
ncbi:hypothetical protein BABINDRAFT_162032 [Babjeviella inositovora NRRL Y-12698]|uniref:Uncharacterized protein n=1 Tax=Babjeviella inositovora NRRL Y-12698 TaxID=984486 RepID=A0A1E3QPQ5_9ASCO|nr:uncharacterized protein BABINDRAFT_162032 [Babjeviella inositovora NRRL Y-12698]ODQ79665.1 hypothetical protein BABINDRAFT_162032 [Babjeviella inositovora NRRL Y-12698]